MSEPVNDNPVDVLKVHFSKAVDLLEEQGKISEMVKDHKHDLKSSGYDAVALYKIAKEYVNNDIEAAQEFDAVKDLYRQRILCQLNLKPTKTEE